MDGGCGTGTWLRPGCLEGSTSMFQVGDICASADRHLGCWLEVECRGTLGWVCICLWLLLCLFPASLTDLPLPLLACFLLPSSGSFLGAALLSGSLSSSPPPRGARQFWLSFTAHSPSLRHLTTSAFTAHPSPGCLACMSELLPAALTACSSRR